MTNHFVKGTPEKRSEVLAVKIRVHYTSVSQVTVRGDLKILSAAKVMFVLLLQSIKLNSDIA